MVGFVDWQTPPAIERKIPRQNRDAWGATTGGTQQESKDDVRQEDEVESSTLTIRGQTGASDKMVTENNGVKATEDRPVREKAQTVGFSEYIFRRKTSELMSLLDALKPNLQTPDGAAIMTSFRRSLEEIWHVAGQLPKEKVVVVSAVEEAVRQKKWRELSIGQVITLQQLLGSVRSSAPEASTLDTTFRAIHRSRIDIYPSATVDEVDAEAEDDAED